MILRKQMQKHAYASGLFLGIITLLLVTGCGGSQKYLVRESIESSNCVLVYYDYPDHTPNTPMATSVEVFKDALQSIHPDVQIDLLSAADIPEMTNATTWGKVMAATEADLLVKIVVWVPENNPWKVTASFFHLDEKGRAMPLTNTGLTMARFDPITNKSDRTLWDAAMLDQAIQALKDIMATPPPS